ncbi:MAG: hypothetical protein ACI95C_002955 [Pseudohongiellaceae bacterium]|jgi:hypothetical protein
MTEPPLSPPRLCSNCRCPLQGDFCSACGQPDKDVKRPLLNLLKELVDVIFELDGRAYRTVLFLFARPGFLSKEYVEGRRASYTPPLRLFLILSILLFFSISFNNFIDGLDTSVANLETAAAASPIGVGDSQTSPSVGDATDGDATPSGATDDEEIASDLQEIEAVITELVLPLISADANSRLINFIISQTETNYRRIREDPSEFISDSLEYITAFLLLMMPLMAVIQKILYIRSKHFYVEHFILTLHNHTFLVLVALISFPLGAAESSSVWIINWPAGLLSIAMNIWVVAYLFLSMKRFYSGGYLLTALKFITATVTYSALLAVGLAIFMAINFILF